MSQLIGTSPTSRYTVHRALPYWYIACASRELGRKPRKAVLWDTPLVLFRDEEGRAHCLLDRCPHRNVPLSEGKCVGSTIECPYHGWKFDGRGECVEIPALKTEPGAKSRRVPKFPCAESQGFVWVYTDTETEPNHDPFRFPELDNPAYSHIRYQADFEGTLHSNAENILDVPHTAYLHRGLFRGVTRNALRTIVKRHADRAECQYLGEPRPTGLLGSILAPRGGEVVHYDRFILPSVAQVEYRLDRRHVYATSVLSPVSEFRTRMYAVVTVKIPSWIPFLQQMVTPFALKVIAQDRVMLAKQLAAIRQFGGENYVYTDVDVLGSQISRLLKRAAEVPMRIGAEPPSSEPEAVIEGELLA